MNEEAKLKVRLLSRSRGQLRHGVRPLVLKYDKGAKPAGSSVKGTDEGGKKRYSSGLKDIQRFEGDVVRVAQRASRALARGIETYRDERERSARKKKDGAIDDFPHNSAQAASVFLKESSDVPVDLVESFNRTSYRKRMRRNLRRVSRLMRLWPI